MKAEKVSQLSEEQVLGTLRKDMTGSSYTGNCFGETSARIQIGFKGCLRCSPTLFYGHSFVEVLVIILPFILQFLVINVSDSQELVFQMKLAITPVYV